jgi:hypothetical protein
MPTLTKNELPGLYDCGLNGVGLLLAWEVDKELLSPWKTAYIVEADDILVEKRDNLVEEMSENKLDRYYWRSQRSWDYGAGQLRFEVNLPGFLSNRAFLDSQGLDVFTNPGQASLLPSTSKILALTNQGPLAPQLMVATDQFVYVAAGQPNLQRFSSLTAADTVAVSTATETAQNVLGIATDGSTVYVALGPDGVHRGTGPILTQIDNFDTITGWSGPAGVTFAADSVDFKEGTASLQVSNTNTSGTNVATKTIAATDMSNVNQFIIWVKSNFAVAAGLARLRLQTSAGNYFERQLPALAAGVWLQDTSVRLTDWVATGAPNWASITAEALVAPNTAAQFRDSRTATTSGFATSITVLVPPLVQNGDLMVMAVSSRKGSQPLQVPGAVTGWTIQGTQINGDEVLQIYTRTASAEPTSYTINTSNSQYSVAAISAYFNHGGFDFISTAGTSAASTSVTVSVSTSSANELVLGVFTNTLASMNIPTVETLHGSGATTAPSSMAYGDEILASPGSISRTASFTSSGNWIGYLVGIKPGTSAEIMHYDDWERNTGSAFSHFSDPDYRVLGWAKDRLYGAGIKTGTQWAFREVGSGATSKEWLALPDGYQVTDIQELGPYVYFTANRNTVSKIYAFDGTNTPFICLTMPPGENAVKLQPFLGAGCLIGARRVGSISPSFGLGVLYRAFPQGSGHLTAERVTTFGADDGKDYAPQAGSAYLDVAYIGRNFPAPNRTGLTAYFPATGGFARHVEASNATGVVVGAVMFKNHKMFTIDGQGVWSESSTGVLEPTGFVLSSVMDWNIDSNKILMKGELATMPLPAGSTATLEYTPDQGKTFTTVGVQSATAGILVSAPIVNVQVQIAQTRATITPDTTTLVSPILKKAGLAALYGLKPRRLYKMAIKAYSYMTLKNGTDHPNSGPGLSVSIESFLQGLRDNQTVVQFQPPGWGEEQTSDIPQVRIGQMKVHRNWTQQSGWSNICLVELFEVPV